MKKNDRSRGTSLLEVMITLAILAGAGLGTMVSLNASGKALKDGQLSQHKMMLLEAKTQQHLLMNKNNLWNLAAPGWSATSTGSGVYPPNVDSSLPTPWVLDLPATATDPDDLSQGAYFSIGANGRIERLDITNPPAVAGNPTCDLVPGPSAIRPVIYCREVALTQGPPVVTKPGEAPAAVAAAGGRVVTYWVRVRRAGESVGEAVYRREVITP